MIENVNGLKWHLPRNTPLYVFYFLIVVLHNLQSVGRSDPVAVTQVFMCLIHFPFTSNTHCLFNIFIDFFLYNPRLHKRWTINNYSYYWNGPTSHCHVFPIHSTRETKETAFLEGSSSFFDIQTLRNYTFTWLAFLHSFFFTKLHGR